MTQIIELEAIKQLYLSSNIDQEFTVFLERVRWSIV